MRRTVTSELVLDVGSPAVLALLVAVADGGYRCDEVLSVRHDGRDLAVTELAGGHGTRLHRVEAPVGRIEVAYRAVVDGVDDRPEVDALDLLVSLRPSRYVDSDRMVGFASVELAGLAGGELLRAVVDWVSSHLTYTSGSSAPTDGASDTLLQGNGVCRDFAHLCVSLLRALDVPARVVAVYAPGLSPMDFHAVAEAYVEGGWHVVDATHLAPRASLLRISTGRDAADTAFLSSHHGAVTLVSQSVSAVVDGDLPIEDRSALMHLQ